VHPPTPMATTAPGLQVAVSLEKGKISGGKRMKSVERSGEEAGGERGSEEKGAGERGADDLSSAVSLV
jgi:hypothetical protein